MFERLERIGWKVFDADGTNGTNETNGANEANGALILDNSEEDKVSALLKDIPVEIG